MRVKNIVSDDFVNYKKPSMFVSTCFCNWKCCLENGMEISVCQNSPLANMPVVDISNEEMISVYDKSIFHSSVVFGGLEPFEQFAELYSFICDFRKKHNDDIVIYTGFNKEEISACIDRLKEFNNIIIKFGRYIPNSEKRFDNILGVTLASLNQYAEKIS